MRSSAEVALLYRISELARRYGLRPSEADAELTHQSPQNRLGKSYYNLEFTGFNAAKHDDFNRMFEALGGEPDDNVLTGEHLSDLEDMVDRALSLAPRARTR